MDKSDLNEFMKLFNVRFDREMQIPKITPFSITSEPMDTAVYNFHTETAYQFIITERQLERLISMLKQKGYYHDEDYLKRLKEEELLLSHPELKRMHDEYKMLLYILCGDEWSGR